MKSILPEVEINLWCNGNLESKMQTTLEGVYQHESLNRTRNGISGGGYDLCLASSRKAETNRFCKSRPGFGIARRDKVLLGPIAAN